MTLTQPSRRGFLAGLLATPAIVQYGHLMPIKMPPLELLPFEPWSGEGLLPISWITREFARQVHNQLTTKGVRAQASARIAECKQHHVNFQYSMMERSLTSKQFSDRVLHPAASAVVKAIQPNGRRLSTALLELPPVIYEAACGQAGGICARGLSDYSIDTDSIITRLDILHS